MKIAQQTFMRDETVAEDPRLGRLKEFDERSRNFSIAPQVTPALKGRTWYMRLTLDQGVRLNVANWDASACTGFSRTGDLAASPNPLKLPTGLPFDNLFAFMVYKLAKTLDPWPGEEYEGSSVLAAAKASQKLGFIGEYRWAFNIDDWCAAISQVGSGIAGTSWFNSMFDPLPNGELVVDPSSGDAGGHAWQIRGIIVSEEGKKRLLGKGRNRVGIPLFRMHNSWGKEWGINGEAFVWADDYERYLMPGGEQMITTSAFRR